MKTLKLVLVVAVMFCFVSSLSYAQDVQKQGACKAYYEKFCRDVKPGQGRIAQCMKKHEGEISLACKEQLEAEREKARDFVKACKPDAEKFCKGIVPGEGRIYRCLKANETQLSPDCTAHFRK